MSTNAWFAYHDQLDVVSDTLAGTPTPAYAYVANALDQRTAAAAAGTAFNGIIGGNR